MTAFDEAARRVADGASALQEAAALVAALDVDELLGLLDGDVPFWPGLADMTGGGYYRHPWPAAAVDRLGIPGFRFSDGPRGVVIGSATCFPVSMARGATFDVELEEEIGRAIGRELRASGANFYGGVCVNLLRHPGWGRAQETYGEDPHHVGELGAALTRGVQEHALACVKHFACNSMENARFSVDVTADERALHEVYLPHFRRVVDEGVASVMSAYNSLNGEWCGDSRRLLTDVLRDEWAFEGFVITDFIFGLRDPVGGLGSGLDVEMPFRQQRAATLPAAMAAGEVSRTELEAPAVRTVATLLRFAEVLARPDPGPEVIACDEHRALARRAAQESIVLLTNPDGLLPVDPTSARRVAVLGRLASVANLGDGGSSDVHPPEVVTPLDGLRSAFPGAVVDHVAEPADAADADLVVIVVGTTKADEGEFLDTASTVSLAELFPPTDHPELGAGASMPTMTDAPSTPEPDAQDAMAPGGDRRTLRLPPPDEALIEAVCAVNARTVVAVMGGSAFVVPWIDRTAATLLLWYPGMEGGHALADIVTGAVPPTGRLPFAVPHDEADLVHFDPDASTETYGLFHGQWHLDREDVEPRFPFGFGLTTTTFELVGARREGDEVLVGVHNAGDRDGVEVVQIYGSVPGSAFERPRRRLVGFARVGVAAGETVEARVVLRLDALEVRLDGEMVTEGAEISLVAARHAGDDGVPVTG
ncbi:MAG: glycoside hydrolase family 3 C-terminal domain-containing protein [Actinomycetota bacterium]